MKFSFFLVTLVFFVGCASIPEYDPVAVSRHEILLLNETVLSQISIGMRQAQVHEMTGESFIIGYALPSGSEASVLKSPGGTPAFKPLVIANPYKKEDLTTNSGTYVIEYYVTAVHQPDGVVSDDELMPLVFKEGILIGKGWDYVKGLRLKTSR